MGNRVNAVLQQPVRCDSVRYFALPVSLREQSQHVSHEATVEPGTLLRLIGAEMAGYDEVTNVE